MKSLLHFRTLKRFLHLLSLKSLLHFLNLSHPSLTLKRFLRLPNQSLHSLSQNHHFPSQNPLPLTPKCSLHSLNHSSYHPLLRAPTILFTPPFHSLLDSTCRLLSSRKRSPSLSLFRPSFARTTTR